MSSVELNHTKELAQHSEECAEETTNYHLLSSGSPDIDDEETSVLPRLGDQYQAELPPLLTESELQLHHTPISSDIKKNSPISSDAFLDANFSFRAGLDIPIMWVHHVGHQVKHEQQEYLSTRLGADVTVSMDSMNKRESQTGHPIVSSRTHDTLPKKSIKAEIPDEPFDNYREFARTMSQEHSTVDYHMDEAAGDTPLPGSSVVSWSDVDLQSFLLGLYIFGKDLVQVRKFMFNKKMGDILSFYYGKFYKSDAHRSWSESRKIKGKRCIHGQRIFTGWRQQELLSRVRPSIPKEVQDKLLEAAKSFSEGRSSLEEFVFTLKDVVGLKLLVEAVGIGKGKYDLTCTLLDTAKSNQAIPIRTEIPVGKACSSLSSGEIIKFLTGGFRLSKAKSSDLFWEAVWPRLLARGWHSEQPKDVNCVGSKNTLVFLVPGINRFSRKKLTKGSHYFDSVSDVLNKVASDPSLIELDSDGLTGSDNYNVECGWNTDAKLDQNGPSDQQRHFGPSDQQRHCYLRPRLPNSYTELVKFTIVDTSLFQGEGPFKVRALQSLPVDAMHFYRASTSSGDTDDTNLEELADSDLSPINQGKSGSVISEYNKFGNTKRCIIGKGMQSEAPHHLVSVSKRSVATYGHNSKDQYCRDSNDKKLMKDATCQSRVKSGEPKYLEPVPKRPRLTGCKYAGDYRSSYFPRGRQFKKEDAHCKKSVEVNEIIGADIGPSKGQSTSASVKEGLDESNKCSSRANILGTDAVCEVVSSQEKRKACNLFDLNIFPPDCDSSDPFCMDMTGSQDGLNPKEPSYPSETKQQSDVPQLSYTSNAVPSMDQPANNARRQSTRNRPPTTRALEALASGFLSTKRKVRGTKTLPSDDFAPRAPRRQRRTVQAPETASTGNLDLANPITRPKIVVSNRGVKEENNNTTNHVSVFDKSVVSNMGVKEEYSSTTNHASVFDQSRAWSERKESQKDHNLLGALYCSEVLD